MDEYAAVVRKFYEVYRPIGRRYNLRVHSSLRRKLKLITGGHTS